MTQSILRSYIPCTSEPLLKAQFYVQVHRHLYVYIYERVFIFLWKYEHMWINTADNRSDRCVKTMNSVVYSALDWTLCNLRTSLFGKSCLGSLTARRSFNLWIKRATVNYFSVLRILSLKNVNLFTFLFLKHEILGSIAVFLYKMNTFCHSKFFSRNILILYSWEFQNLFV